LDEKLKSPLHRRTICTAAVAILCLGVATLSAAQAFITPTTPGWAFTTETATGSGLFVAGPPGSPLGSPGSIQLTVGNPGGEFFSTAQYAGTRLDQMAGIRYDTFIVSSALPVTATLQFDFDNDVTAPTPSYGGRAVFDPGLLGGLAVGTWQSWNPMTQKAWWGSGVPGTRPLNSVCTQAAPCTFAQILAAFPNGGVLADILPGAFGFKLGNGGGPSVVSVDGFDLGIAGPGGPVTRFLFAPFSPAAQVPAVPASLLVLMALLLAAFGMRARSRSN
jgi:hypothetical protein